MDCETGDVKIGDIMYKAEHCTPEQLECWVEEHTGSEKSPD